MRPMNPVSDAQMQIPQHLVFGNKIIDGNEIIHDFDFDYSFGKSTLEKIYISQLVLIITCGFRDEKWQI